MLEYCLLSLALYNFHAMCSIKDLRDQLIDFKFQNLTLNEISNFSIMRWNQIKLKSVFFLKKKVVLKHLLVNSKFSPIILLIL